TWAAADPDGFTPPGEVFDAIGVTTYFGGKVPLDEVFVERLKAAIADPDVDAYDFLRDEVLTNEDLGGSIPFKNKQYKAHLSYVEARGYDLGLVAYEGGQHIHHLFATGKYDPELSDFLAGFLRSEQAADLYRASWASWEEWGSGPYSQFGDVSISSRWGSWGVREHLGDETPRADALDELNAETPAWWGEDRTEGAFLQGVTRYGDRNGETDDLLVGTAEEDYLIGRAGDDTLIGGAGDDGLHGGAGEDVAVFAGKVGDYEVSEVGGGYVVRGADGIDRIVEIERLVFDDGVVELSEGGPVTVGGGGAGGEDGGDDGGSNGEGGEAGPVEVDYGEAEGALNISSIRVNTALARELDADADDATYAVVARTSSASFDGVGEIKANYFAVHQNRASKTGPELAESAVAAALSFGEIVEEVEGGVRGSRHSDRFNGWGADDKFHGGGGHDSILTRQGDDVIVGGEGDDRITTGTGSDLVIFRKGDGADLIFDFSADDTLELQDIDAARVRVYEHQTRDDRIVMDFGGGDSVTLVGVDVEDVSSLNILY
ncbi:MAG: hypothetical protein AAF322_19255, partial [Pseudomonadota bacterium]